MLAEFKVSGSDKKKKNFRWIKTDLTKGKVKVKLPARRISVIAVLTKYFRFNF